MNEKQADTLLNVPEIVKRAKIALNLKRDSELASYLGVARATLSNWCARNSIDFPLLLNKLRHVDYNWLLTGKGSPLHDPKSFDNGKIRGEVETIHNSKTTEAIDDRSVTLYDMYPILKSGDIVGFKEINNFSNVIYGEMYIVAFHLDGDQYLTVKYVNRSEKEGYVKLVSYNPHHEPMDLPVDTIQDMAIVKFSIRKNMMM